LASTPIALPGAGDVLAEGRWGSKVNDNIGQAGDSPQAVRLIEIGDYRVRALGTPERALCRIANQRQDMVVAAQMRQHAARDVAATDNQQLLHGAILPGSDISV